MALRFGDDGKAEDDLTRSFHQGSDEAYQRLVKWLINAEISARLVEQAGFEEVVGSAGAPIDGWGQMRVAVLQADPPLRWVILYRLSTDDEDVLILRIGRTS